jgi:hypothetical protein
MSDRVGAAPEIRVKIALAQISERCVLMEDG